MMPTDQEIVHEFVGTLSPEQIRSRLKAEFGRCMEAAANVVTNGNSERAEKARLHHLEQAALCAAVEGLLRVTDWANGDGPLGLRLAKDTMGVDLAAIADRIRPTISPTYGSGPHGLVRTVEGRITAEDFNAIAGLFGLMPYDPDRAGAPVQ